MSWLRNSLLVAGMGAICLTTAAPASAAAPVRGSASFTDEGTDAAGTTCPFPVHFRQSERWTYTIYSDASGEFLRVAIHITYEAQVEAHGVTLSERDTFRRTIDADGTMRDTGLTAHVQGPEGLVIRDAGMIAYSDTDDTVVYVRGPHPQLLGADFCAALAP
jgi:hypothetical protein